VAAVAPAHDAGLCNQGCRHRRYPSAQLTSWPKTMTTSGTTCARRTRPAADEMQKRYKPLSIDVMHWQQRQSTRIRTLIGCKNQSKRPSGQQGG
jgi:hypothetical protein